MKSGIHPSWVLLDFPLLKLSSCSTSTPAHFPNRRLENAATTWSDWKALLSFLFLSLLAENSRFFRWLVSLFLSILCVRSNCSSCRTEVVATTSEFSNRPFPDQWNGLLKDYLVWRLCYLWMDLKWTLWRKDFFGCCVVPERTLCNN